MLSWCLIYEATKMTAVKKTTAPTTVAAAAAADHPHIHLCPTTIFYSPIPAY